MKLLMITGDRLLAEGKHGAFYNTLEQFHKYWERVDIICPKILSAKRQVPSVFFGNVYVHPSPWPLIFQLLWILKKGKRIYKEQKFDLITVHEFPPFYNGIGARLLWYKIKIPYVLEVHHIPGYPKASSFKETIYRILMKLFIKFDASKARAVRVVNQNQTPEFLMKARVPKEKIVYIPSMYIDLEVFKPLNLQKDYDLIFVGRLEKNKGIDLLLDAANKLKAQILNFKMIIVGDGPLRKNLKFKIENLKLQDIILLYGWAKNSNEIAELMNKSKILVMSSYNEGGPRVIVEAMACGVSVVATNVGLVPDLIKDGESGSIINWDANDIAEKISDLLSDKDRQREYGQEGLKIAERFEKKSAIKNYANKLKEVLS